MPLQPTRGDVWWVDLGMVAKIRPALILSVPTTIGSDRDLVTIVPHTTSTGEAALRWRAMFAS